MEKTISIQEAIKSAMFAENVELIEVPEVSGFSFTLLRVKEMPEFAFLMRPSDYSSATYSRISFKMKSDVGNGSYSSFLEGEVYMSESYFVVCTCCTKSIIQHALDTCIKNNIHTVFVRKAHMNNTKGIAVVEADNCVDAMCELYGRKIVRESFKFVNSFKSQGIGELGRM